VTSVHGGAQFQLSDAPEKDWLSWSPHIGLGKEEP
jgi:hypothetical protein